MASSPNKEGQAPRIRLARNELSAFCAQIAMLLGAGIPLPEGMAILLEDALAAQSKHSFLQEILHQLEQGKTFFTALKASGAFPKYMVDMVEIGEQTGRLEGVMESLGHYYQREESIARSIKSAITYPLVMILIMVLVIGVLVVQVLPVFNQVFVQLGSEMTGPSKTILQLGMLVGRYSAALTAAGVLLVAFGLFLRFSTTGQHMWQRLRHSLVFTRKLSAQTASARFASSMALMLASGLDTDEALEMTQNLIENPLVRSKIQQCKTLLGQGKPFAEALSQSGIFGGVHARMVAVGFKTGSVDTVMQQLATEYEEELDTQVNRMISILEPTLVAVLSIVVGLILLSVMLPLMGIMSTIG